MSLLSLSSIWHLKNDKFHFTAYVSSFCTFLLLLFGNTYSWLAVTMSGETRVQIQCVKEKEDEKRDQTTSIVTENSSENVTSTEWEDVSLLKYSWRVYVGRTSSPSWRVHTRTRTHIDTLIRSSKFLCLFFVVYRAVSGIDASVRRRSREALSLSLPPSPSLSLSLSLARHELCFRNVWAIYTERARTYIYVHPRVRGCVQYTYTRMCIVYVYRAIANACVWSGLTCAREPRAWLEKEKNRKSKVPRLVIHRHSAPPVRRHYLRFRGRTNFLIRVGAGGKCTSAARASSHRSRGFLSAKATRVIFRALIVPAKRLSRAPP